MERLRQTHEFGPLYDANSEILILGSFPSVKSRESSFYYGHPQNRFWKVIAKLYGEKVPETIEQKKNMLLAHRIALWDVIESCTIEGSSDSSIRDVVANPIERLVLQTKITKIYTNGNKSDKLYEKYCEEIVGKKAMKLPSTSPANAAWSLDRLAEAWEIIKTV